MSLTSLMPACLATCVEQALWLEARGAVGVGAAETVTTALAFVAEHEREWIDQVTCVESLADWAERHRSDIDVNPAAWTAVELACLNLLANNLGCSLEGLLGVPELAGRFCYTAVLDDAPIGIFATRLDQLLAMGFESFKLILSGTLQDDRARIRLLQNAGVAEARVRTAPSQPWSDSCSCVRYIDALGYRFMAVEEPVRAANFATLNRVARALDTAIILNASVARREQLQDVPTSNHSWIIDCQVSRMGGLLRCLQMLEALRSCGLRAIVGTRTGETIILARAALTVANVGRDIVLAQDGFFGPGLPYVDLSLPERLIRQ